MEANPNPGRFLGMAMVKGKGVGTSWDFVWSDVPSDVAPLVAEGLALAKICTGA